MNKKQQDELVSFGNHIEIRVTPAELSGNLKVHIRDFEFFDFISAALYLQQIQRLESPESSCYLVG